MEDTASEDLVQCIPVNLSCNPVEIALGQVASRRDRASSRADQAGYGNSFDEFPAQNTLAAVLAADPDVRFRGIAFGKRRHLSRIRCSRSEGEFVGALIEEVGHEERKIPGAEGSDAVESGCEQGHDRRLNEELPDDQLALHLHNQLRSVRRHCLVKLTGRSDREWRLVERREQLIGRFAELLCENPFDLLERKRPDVGLDGQKFPADSRREEVESQTESLSELDPVDAKRLKAKPERARRAGSCDDGLKKIPAQGPGDEATVCDNLEKNRHHAFPFRDRRDSGGG